METQLDPLLSICLCYLPQSPHVEASQSGITTGCSVAPSSARRQNLFPGLNVKVAAKRQRSRTSAPPPAALLLGCDAGGSPSNATTAPRLRRTWRSLWNVAARSVCSTSGAHTHTSRHIVSITADTHQAKQVHTL